MNLKPACFVATIDSSLENKLRTDLAEQGFSFSQPEHTLFSAQKKGISCTLYASGKLTVQGKEKDDFISFYLEPEILHNFSYSHPTLNLDLSSRIGIDEAGKGDFFGPLCIAGVQAGGDQIEALVKLGVRDSKTLSDKSILMLSKKIRLEFPHSVIRISPQKYNDLYEKFGNLNRLLAWGHATAIEELIDKTGCKSATIDKFGGEHLVLDALKRKNLIINLTQKTHAESDPVVAAASILARAAFVEGIESLERTISLPLPKGASDKVVQAGKILVNKLGKEALRTVSKLHFKTRDVILSCFIFGASSLFSIDYYGITNETPRHLEGEYRYIGRAEFDTNGKAHGSHLLYSDAGGTVSYAQSLPGNDVLAWEIGYSYLGIDWNQNPRFRGKNYNYGIGSLSWIGYPGTRWRCIVSGGLSVDVKTFNFGQTAVYWGLGWATYNINSKWDIHFGALGYRGVENGRLFPLVGVNWNFLPKWKAVSIFPLDYSIEYQFASHWYTKLGYQSFGGPYRFPRRVHDGIGRYRDGIFEVFSNGIELDLLYRHKNLIQLKVGGGWDFGGWILIKDQHNRHGKYYHFDSAPFGVAKLTLNI